MFGLWRAWKRSRFEKRDLPAHWVGILEENVPFFEAFDVRDRERFLSRLKVFVWRLVWIEAGGMSIDDEVRVVIAAAAVRLVLHLDEDIYGRLSEVVVYPSHFHHPAEDSVVLGEAHAWGTVVLSWDAVVQGLKNPHDGHDTATHEFAHVLDRNSGDFNGTPELRARGHYRPWALVLSECYERLRAGKKGERRVLREYGATNEAEFFAVATEAFFERPEQMAESTPDLYAELRRFYGVDPQV
ncbi:MAG: zinc-dependent peptidase [Myxococcales bacterium]|nr:zinc-dependent peptidase [Myxococcales bacterium]